jgi:uncharacterized membrane protein (DUF441 family)
MTEIIEQATTNAVVVVPLILAVVQAFKMTGLPSKWAPMVSIGMGIVVAFFASNGLENLEQNFGTIILHGVIYGLSASGLYSGTKTMAHAPKTNRDNE